MKNFFLPIFLIISLHVFAQVRYEPGYIVTNQGERAEVLILNKEWRDNPTEFSYKYSESSNPETGRIQDIKEFGIGDQPIYERFSTQIDQSGDQVRNMSTNPEPNFVEKTVFLQKLVEGEASLYIYNKGVERFFVLTPDVGLTPLIHKKYLQNNSIATNNKFRQQLYNEVSCGENPSPELRKTSYRKQDLVKYFEKYNECRQAEYRVLEESKKKLRVNFSIKAGLDFSTLTIEKGIYVNGAEIELDPRLRFGGEIEVVMPFNKNKWSIFAEPTYSRIKIERMPFVSEVVHNRHEVDLSLKYEFITTATGLRHYFFLDNFSKIFLSGGFSFVVPLETTVLIDRDERYQLDPELNKIKTEAHLNVGLGYAYRGLSAEIRYDLPQTATGQNEEEGHYVLDWQTRTTSFSVLLGYKLF